MNPVLARVLNPAVYEALPESIKATYTPDEYAWLSDEQKARLIQTETEPDAENY